jgi:hypothetical protein
LLSFAIEAARLQARSYLPPSFVAVGASFAAGTSTFFF